MNEKPLHIAITGVAGFIGSHLAQSLLQDGHSVVGLDNFDPLYPRPLKEHNVSLIRECGGEFTFIEGDVRSPAALDQMAAGRAPDAVVHLAACADMFQAENDPVNYTDVNVSGTLQLLEFCVRHNVPSVVFASSCLVYGQRTEVPFRETDPACTPRSLYAATKLAGEQLLHAYCKLHGLNTTCLRFFTVYGPRQRPTMAIHRFVELATEGKSIELHGHGKVARDFAYVSDIVSGVRLALNRMGGYQLYNLGYSEAFSLLELVETIREVSGLTVNYSLRPEHPGDVNITYAGIDLARQHLGWSPKVGLKEGLTLFVRWYQGSGRKIALASLPHMNS